MKAPAAQFIREATILWCAYAVQERKKAEGLEPVFTFPEVEAQKQQMGLADRVRVYEIAAKLEKKCGE